MTTWGQLKAAIKGRVFATGEAPNLVAAHDKAAIDAILDLQTVVDCLQYDNTSLIPQCATLYNCGLTVFDAPRGSIKRVSVIDKLQDATDSSSSTTVLPTPIGSLSRFVFGNVVNGDLVAAVIAAGSYTILIEPTNLLCVSYNQSQRYGLVVQYTDGAGVLQTISKSISMATCSDSIPMTVTCAANSQVTMFISREPPPLPVNSGPQVKVTVTPNQSATVSTPADDADYCSEIVYDQVNPCHIQQYLDGSRRRGCCLSIPLFFGLSPAACGRAAYPVPTDAGIPAGLPVLPLGFYYPQTSTDRQRGRSRAGVWAIERGKIFIAPWIQSTETVMVTWDGIKRSWGDADPVDDDPLLAEAIEEYVRWKHADKYDKDESEATRAAGAYEMARMKLIHQCREETRVRGCEPSHARMSGGVSSSGGTGPSVSLFYNDAPASASASCPSGTAGDPVMVTIPAGTVASTVSVSDANQKAASQAQSQAAQQLICAPVSQSFTNDAQSYTATCQGSPNAPAPEGNQVTITIPAGTVTSLISKADANAQALALAQQQASAALSCTFWNAAQTFTASCPTDHPGADVTKTVPAHTYSSKVSQADADALALTEATNQANAALNCASGVIYTNSPQACQANRSCFNPRTQSICTVNVVMVVPAGLFSSPSSVGAANSAALAAGNSQANAIAGMRCSAGICGVHQVTYPGY